MPIPIVPPEENDMVEEDEIEHLLEPDDTTARERSPEFQKFAEDMAARTTPEQRAGLRSELISGIDPAGLLPMAGAAAANFLPMAAPARIASMAGRIMPLLEGAGAALGEAGREKIRVGEIDPLQVAKTGALTALGSGAARMVLRTIGNVARFSKGSIGDVMGQPFSFTPKGRDAIRIPGGKPGDFSATLSKPGTSLQTATFDLAEIARGKAQVYSTSLTEKYTSTVKPYFDSGPAQTISVPVDDILAAMDRHLSKPAAFGPGPRNIANTLGDIRAGLAKAAEANGGKVSAKYLNEFIHNTLDPVSYTGTGGPGATRIAQILQRVRGQARKTLGDNIPPEVDLAIREIEPEIRSRQIAAKRFANKEPGAVVKELNKLFEPGNEDALMALQKVDPRLVADIRTLATKKGLVATREVGMLRRLAGRVFKILAPLRGVAGPAAALKATPGDVTIPLAAPAPEEADIDHLLEAP